MRKEETNLVEPSIRIERLRVGSPELGLSLGVKLRRRDVLQSD